MALVPFRTLGPAADQTAQERLFQVGSLAIIIRQHPKAALRPRDPAPDSELPDQPSAPAPRNAHAPATAPASQAGGQGSSEQPGVAGPSLEDHLGNVGLVAWQCGLVLTELLLRHPPFGAWTGLRAVDLGSGTGLVGIALALCGAQVTLTDLAYVIPLTALNVEDNCARHLVAQRPAVKVHVWGDAESAAELLPHPDLITAADVLYDPQYYPNLLTSLQLLCAPHTLVYLAWKKRHVEEEGFKALAEDRGFVVEEVPLYQLAEEYRDGSYAVLRLAVLDAMQCSTATAAE